MLLSASGISSPRRGPRLKTDRECSPRIAESCLATEKGFLVYCIKHLADNFAEKCSSNFPRVWRSAALGMSRMKGNHCLKRNVKRTIFGRNFRILLFLIVAFSLGILPSPLASHFRLPVLPTVRANSESSAGLWYPAGPQMATLSISTFGVDPTGQSFGFNSLLGNQIDLLSSPLSAAQQNSVPCLTSNTITCSLPIPAHGYSEIEFNLAGVLWGIPQAYGANAAGIELRQGIAHLLNKQSYVSNESPCSQGRSCLANDEPNALCDINQCVNGGLPAPNPCGWDTKYSQNSVSNCVVGAPGGTSYNCGYSTACPTGTVSGSTTYAWQAPIGSPDFCAAANHLIQAFTDASITGVTLNASCELNPPSGGWPSVVTAFPPSCENTSPTAAVCLSVQQFDTAQVDLGRGIGQDICALFSPAWVSGGWTTLLGKPTFCDNSNTGSGNSACGGGSCPFLEEIGNTFDFHGLPFSAHNYCAPSQTGVPNNCWGIWTGGCENCFPFDTSLYFKYNSLFATKTTVICTNADCSSSQPGSTCSSTSPTSDPNDYMYVCVPAYDTLSSLMESAQCLSSPGPAHDPVIRQASASFASCSGGSVSGTCSSTSACTSISSGYQAEDAFGSRALTIPVWSSNQVFGRQNNWALGSTSAPGIVNAIGGRTTGIPNFFTLLNAYTNNPAVSGDFRVGISPQPNFLNPFQASSDSDLLIIKEIYDTLFVQNPMCTNSAGLAATAGVPTCSSIIQDMEWMTTSHSFPCFPGGPTCNSQSLGYGNSTYFAGTTADLRLTLNRGNHWHDGPPVTAWDVKYSFMSLNATGAFQAIPLSNITHMNVLDQFTLDLNLRTRGPFTEALIGSVTIIPGHVWSACGAGTWNTSTTSKNILGSSIVNAPEDSCVGIFGSPSIAIVGGVRADSPTFDPMANNFLIGSGPYSCQSIGTAGHPAVGTLGGGCSIDNTQSPAPQLGAYTLTRTGCTLASTGTSCNPPGSGSNYFKSSGALAKYIWTGDIGDGSADFSKVLTVNSCHSPTPSANCPHWAQGIGNPNGPNPVGLGQRTAVNFYKGTSWIAFTTEQTNGTPLILTCAAGYTMPLTTITQCTSQNAGWTGSILPGIGSYPPTLFEVLNYPAMLSPASISGCNPNTTYPSGDGYDC